MHRKMLNNTNHEGKEKTNEIAPHTPQDGDFQKISKQKKQERKGWTGCVEIGTLLHRWWESNERGVAAVETGAAAPQKPKWNHHTLRQFPF